MRTIKNRKTGETIQVHDHELAKYGIKLPKAVNGQEISLTPTNSNMNWETGQLYNNQNNDNYPGNQNPNNQNQFWQDFGQNALGQFNNIPSPSINIGGNKYFQRAGDFMNKAQKQFQKAGNSVMEGFGMPTKPVEEAPTQEELINNLKTPKAINQPEDFQDPMITDISVQKAWRGVPFMKNGGRLPKYMGGGMNYMKFADAAVQATSGAIDAGLSGLNTGKGLLDTWGDLRNNAQVTQWENQQRRANLQQDYMNLPPMEQFGYSFQGRNNVLKHGGQIEDYKAYNQGGMANVETENNEVAQLNNGLIDTMYGADHSQGGIKMQLPEGTKILSEKLKHPTLKKSFAKLAKKLETKKDIESLESPISDKISKQTAEMNIQFKNKKLDELFNEQEQMKMDGTFGTKVQTQAFKEQGIMANGGEIPNGLETKNGTAVYENGMWREGITRSPLPKKQQEKLNSRFKTEPAHFKLSVPNDNNWAGGYRNLENPQSIESKRVGWLSNMQLAPYQSPETRYKLPQKVEINNTIASKPQFGEDFPPNVNTQIPFTGAQNLSGKTIPLFEDNSNEEIRQTINDYFNPQNQQVVNTSQQVTQNIQQPIPNTQLPVSKSNKLKVKANYPKLNYPQTTDRISYQQPEDVPWMNWAANIDNSASKRGFEVPIADQQFGQKYYGTNDPQSLTNVAYQEQSYDDALDTPEGRKALARMWDNVGNTNLGEQLGIKLPTGKLSNLNDKDLTDVLSTLRPAYLDSQLDYRKTNYITPTAIKKQAEEKASDPVEARTDKFQGNNGNFKFKQGQGININIPKTYERLPVWMKNVNPEYIDPRYLNIQSNLNDINRQTNAFNANISDRTSSNIGNLLQAQGNALNAKNQLYQTKYNYDKQADSQAQQFNAQSKMRTDQINLGEFNNFNDKIAQREAAIQAQKDFDYNAATQFGLDQDRFAQQQEMISEMFNPSATGTGQTYTFNQLTQTFEPTKKEDKKKMGGIVKSKKKLKIKKSVKY